MSLKDRAWGFGANVGVLIKAGEKTRFGVTYLSAVKLGFQRHANLHRAWAGLSAILANPSELDLGMTVPQSVMVSVYHALNDKWAVMADFGWQDWSQFGYVQAGVEAGGTTTLNLQLPGHLARRAGCPVSGLGEMAAVGRRGLRQFGGGQRKPHRHVADGPGVALWPGRAIPAQPIGERRRGLHLPLGGRHVGGSRHRSRRCAAACRVPTTDAWFTFANLNLTWKF